MASPAMLCPKGHLSNEPDYCSECGARMDAPVAVSAPALSAASPGELCPDCGTPREGMGVFCEICGYNFVTGARGELPVFTPPQAPVSVAQSPPPPVQDTHPASSWSAVVSVDPTLREPGSPEPPAGVGPFTFALAQPVTLIGRRSEARAIFPEIPLSYDDAVSHRHALLQLASDGTLTLRDIGASNGTRLNGQEISSMVDHPLKDGDAITLGHWSRLQISAVHHQQGS